MSGRCRLPLLAAALLLAGCQPSRDTAELDAALRYGGPSDVAFALSLWNALTDAGLAGPEALQTRPYPGRVPHGPLVQQLHGLLRVGTQMQPVLVLRSYAASDGGALDAARVLAAPERYLRDISVMYRRPGYDAADRDWYWVSYNADGSLRRDAQQLALAGRISAPDGSGGCSGCHRAAPGDDRVFAHNRYR